MYISVIQKVLFSDLAGKGKSEPYPEENKVDFPVQFHG